MHLISTNKTLRIIDRLLTENEMIILEDRAMKLFKESISFKKIENYHFINSPNNITSAYIYYYTKDRMRLKSQFEKIPDHPGNMKQPKHLRSAYEPTKSNKHN